MHRKSKNETIMATEIQLTASEQLETLQLYTDVCNIIDDTRNRIAVYVNSEVCHTNWRIGKRIKEGILFNKRAEYGKQVVKNLSVKLTERYGKGWGESIFDIVYALRILFRKMRLSTQCGDNSVGLV